MANGLPAAAYFANAVAAAMIAACLFVAQSAAAQKAGPCRFELLGMRRPSPSPTGAASASPMAARSSSQASMSRRAGSKAALAAKTALENLVLGKDIAVARAVGRHRPLWPDRCFCLRQRLGNPGAIQSPGARAGPGFGAGRRTRPARRRCSREEQKAREARIGLWGDPGYAVRAAGDGPATEVATRPFFGGRRACCVGSGQRGHDLRQFRKALVGGSDGHYPETP